MDEAIYLELTYINNTSVGLSKIILTAEYKDKIEAVEVAYAIVVRQKKLKSLIDRNMI